MPSEILRKDARRLIESGAQVLDVLKLSEYRESHLPGAVHIHLRMLAGQARQKRDPSRPVVVSCYDFARYEPRAASRIESLGFREVYDYAAGRVDWFAAGLPMEGVVAETVFIGKLAMRRAAGSTTGQSLKV